MNDVLRYLESDSCAALGRDGAYAELVAALFVRGARRVVLSFLMGGVVQEWLELRRDDDWKGELERFLDDAFWRYEDGVVLVSIRADTGRTVAVRDMVEGVVRTWRKR